MSFIDAELSRPGVVVERRDDARGVVYIDCTEVTAVTANPEPQQPLTPVEEFLNSDEFNRKLNSDNRYVRTKAVMTLLKLAYSLEEL
jgi:hypothetical protein